MELENVIKLINAVSESSLTSFSMEDGDTKLSLGVDRNDRAVVNNSVDTTDTENNNEVCVLNKSDMKTTVKHTQDCTHNKSTDTKEAEKIEDNALTISSPLVGIFYSAAGPDDAAFVSVGDKVKKGQVVGIVEAMKLMNEIESDYDGVVTDILVDNEQVVEYGQPMFVIKPV